MLDSLSILKSLGKPYQLTVSRPMSDDKVIPMDNYRPSLSIPHDDGSQRVIPLSVLEDVIEGKINFQDIEDWEGLIRPILQDAYAFWMMYEGEDDETIH